MNAVSVNLSSLVDVRGTKSYMKKTPDVIDDNYYF